ncbi:hypothetical protein ABZS79_12185 [Streptomyces griseoloalbus]|uniref:hypothetical protein n=1 Tax=Streptomyces griseoloalbus TaxID=67303 RepID=UPI0033B7DEF8
MFAAAGFGEAVDLARTVADTPLRARSAEAEAEATAGLIGDPAAVRTRMDACVAAGPGEIAAVQATAGDPGGERTRTALAPR